MKKLSVAVFAGLILFSLNSCRKIVGSGPIATEKRIPAPFTELEFEVPGELVFIQSEVESITLEGHRNILDIVETNVNNGELKVKLQHNRVISSGEHLRITVEGPNARSFKVSGSGNLFVPDSLSADDLKLRISGSGKILVTTIKAKNLEVKISGSGNVEALKGEVGNEQLDIEGSGDIDLSNVPAEAADTETSGSGNIRLFVNERLNAKIAGSGDVWYRGRPLIDTRISGSGNVKRID